MPIVERRPQALPAIAAGVLCTALALAGGIALSPAADAQDVGNSSATPPAERPRPEPTADDPIYLVEQTPWVAADGHFSVTVALHDDVPDDSRLELVVHRALTTRDAFTRSLETADGGARLSVPYSQPIDDIDQDEDGTATASFAVAAGAPDGAGLAGRDGVYPITIQLVDADGQTGAEVLTHLLYLPPPTPAFSPLAVSTVLELGTSPAHRPDGSLEFSPDALQNVRDRADLMNQMDVALSFAPLPETLDALAQLDDLSDEPANDDLSLHELIADGVRDAAPGSEVLARPYVDIDLDQWSAAGLITEVAPEAEAGARVIRSQLDVEPVPHIWLTDPTVSDIEARTWRDMGVTAAILPDESVAPIPDPTDSINPPVNLPGDITAFVSDDALVDRLLSVDQALDTYRFLAELTMIWREYPSRDRAVVLRIPEDVDFDPAAVSATLNHLDHGQAVEAIPASTLFELAASEDIQPVDAALAAKARGDDLAWMQDALESGKHQLRALQGMLDISDNIGAYERDLLIAPGRRIDRQARLRYLDNIDGNIEAIADAISVPQGFRITLTARDASIPLTISNDLNESITVRIHLHSNQLEFPDGNSFEVEVPPGHERVDVDVRTRTSGGFPLRITVTSPDSRILLDESTFDIRSTTISGVGLVLSVGAGAFLMVWWGRHWYRTRRGDPDGVNEGSADSAGP